MVPVDLRHKVRVDLKWFQDEYKKGEQSRYYAHASRDNNISIDAFIRYLKNKEYSRKLQINAIEDYLKKMYVR